MSLYNALFGVNPVAPVLLQALGTNVDRIPRFRDIYIAEVKGKRHIVIYTRTGGGNRDWYESEAHGKASNRDYDYAGPWNEDLRALPGFLHDEDDSFDGTYAHFHYEVPKAFVGIIDSMLQVAGGTPPPQEKWEKLLDDLRQERTSPEVKRAMKVGEQVLKDLATKPDGIVEV